MQVCWNKKSCKWQAALNNHGLYIYIGCFDSEVRMSDYFDLSCGLLWGETSCIPAAVRLSKPAGHGKPSGAELYERKVSLLIVYR